jgi:hypothetical protein
MTLKRLVVVAMAVFAVAVLVGSVGAGAARTPGKTAGNLSTNSKVRDYLRSLGISPRGVVIQRGARNYAGPRCPGKRWTCTRSHRVVQISTHRGKNSFRCSVARCVVVQATKSLLATNTARCIRTTGITQSCSINQSSTSADNEAIVVEIATKTSGLTQSASQSAQIVQRAGSGANRACVLQTTTIEGSTVAKRGVPVNVNLDAHQSTVISQDSASGGNTAKGASSSGACASGALDQSQTIRSTATGTASITQNENKTVGGRNMFLDIEQNQSAGFFNTATGLNMAAFSQVSSLTALATSPTGPVEQWQSQPESAGGGVDAIVNQDSRDKSTASAFQKETQCARAVKSGPLSCATQNTLPVRWTQTQYGPVRKGGCCSARPGNAGRHFMLRKGSSPSKQTGNDTDEFIVHQESTQDVDAAPDHPEQVTQANFVQGECSTSGSCTVGQTTTVNGQTTTNTQSGPDVDASINCAGSACTTAGHADVLVAGTGDLGSTEPNDNLTQLLSSAGYSVTESATLPGDLSGFGQVWWVDALPSTSAEQNQLIDFAQSGKGVFLTGERPCCEALNAADQSIVNAVVVGGGITVGGQGDVCGCNAPLPVNPGVVGNVATQPFNVTTWQPAAPGGMANVPDSSVFSYYQPGDPSTRQTVAAVWDRPSVVGNGRLVVFMDINWTEAAWRAANWSDVAQNVAFFLSGLTSPPGSVVTSANVVPAAPALFSAQAKATLARTASGGATSSK